MERVTFVTHRGTRILRVDYSGLGEVEDLLRVADRARRLLP